MECGWEGYAELGRMDSFHGRPPADGDSVGDFVGDAVGDAASNSVGNSEGTKYG